MAQRQAARRAHRPSVARHISLEDHEGKAWQEVLQCRPPDDDDVDVLAVQKILYKPEVIEYVYQKLDVLAREPLFNIDALDYPDGRDKKRLLTDRRYRRLVELGFFSEAEGFANPNGVQSLSHILNQLDPGLAVKRAMSQEVFALSLVS